MNSTAAQRVAILNHLRTQGRLSTLQARSLGWCHPAARIQELRERGFNITTNRITEADAAGVDHSVAIYTLDGGSAL